MGPGKSWITVQPSGGGVSLDSGELVRDDARGSLRGLVIATPDVDAEHARLKKLGVDVDDIKDAPWGRSRRSATAKATASFYNGRDSVNTRAHRETVSRRNLLSCCGIAAPTLRLVNGLMSC